VGIFLISNGLIEKQYPGILIGSWFSLMALFNFGCAGGQCGIPIHQSHRKEVQKKEIEFEEVKQ
jgi:hypothetical protein